MLPRTRFFSAILFFLIGVLLTSSVAYTIPSVGIDLPLSGHRIALAAGHGYYDTSNGWNWQREWQWGIIEDLVNADIQLYAADYLTNLGATVIYVREPNKNAGPGVSNLPRWQEAARHYLQFVGTPEWVWNDMECDVVKRGTTRDLSESLDNLLEQNLDHQGVNPNLCKDIRSRPFAANYYDADILINIHNNGGGGTGTEIWYDTTGLNHDPADSLMLAQVIHPRLINALRTYNSQWTDRGIKPAAGDYGENRLAQMPAILIEVAFMDMQTPDNAALHDEIFKQLAAEGIVQGICDYYGVVCNNFNPPPLKEVIILSPIIHPDYGSGMCESGWLQITGYNGAAGYLTLNTDGSIPSTNWAEWHPILPVQGLYKVEAWITNHPIINWQCPDVIVNWDTTQAPYTIYAEDGVHSVWGNQQYAADAWIDLGTFPFQAGGNAWVELRDLNGEPSLSRTISFSALRFTLQKEFPERVLYLPLILQ